MTQLFAFTAPILQGQTERFLKFSNTLKNEKNNEFKAARKRLGIRERTFLQRTPMGDFAIVTLEGENPAEAMKKIGEGKDEFTQWFMKEVKAIHGFDMDKPMEGPMNELIVDSGELKLIMA